MRILFVASYPLDENNGYAVNSRSTVERLVAAGHEVDVASVLPFRNWNSRYSSRSWSKSVGVRRFTALVAMPDRGVHALRRSSDLRLRCLLKQIVNTGQYDLVHARGIRAGSLCATLDGREKVVLDIRGDIVAEARAALAAGESGCSRSRIEWAMSETVSSLERADAFACVSEAMREWLSEQVEIGGRPCTVIPCPVDVERFACVEREVHSDGPLVCYLGGLQAYQSADLVFSAFLQVARAVGPLRAWVITPDDAAPLIARLHAAGFEAWAESLSHGQVAERLTGADFGLLPRCNSAVNRVAAPTKIGEYLAAGVPILIGEGLSVWGRILGTNGVAAPLNDHAALKKFSLRVVSERSYYRARCRAVAVDEWSWDHASRKIEALYDTIAGAGT